MLDMIEDDMLMMLRAVGWCLCLIDSSMMWLRIKRTDVKKKVVELLMSLRHDQMEKLPFGRLLLGLPGIKTYSHFETDWLEDANWLTDWRLGWGGWCVGQSVFWGRRWNVPCVSMTSQHEIKNLFLYLWGRRSNESRISEKSFLILSILSKHIINWFVNWHLFFIDFVYFSFQ